MKRRVVSTGLVLAGALLLALLPIVVGRFDPEWLDYEAGTPGFLDRLVRGGLLAAGFVIVCAILSRGFDVSRPTRRGLAALVVVAFVLHHALAACPEAWIRGKLETSEAAERDGFDPEALMLGLADLGRRIGVEVPEGGRIAVIHRPVQPDFPVVFLAPVLYPRIFYLYETHAPPRAALHGEGIGWILDLTRATHRDRYAGALLKRVGGTDGAP